MHSSQLGKVTAQQKLDCHRNISQRSPASKHGHFCRLEELSEARQSVVAKVKAAERDRDSLEGAKTVAEAYLGKERECALAHASLYQIFLRDGQVRTAPATG